MGGAIPMIFVAYTTAPFVTFAHINLPHFALRSKDQLMRWVERMPPSAELHLTTMKFYGLPRVSRLSLSELRQKSARLGVANFVKVPSSVARKSRPWWMGREPSSFYISSEPLKARPAALWQTTAWKKVMLRQILDKIQE